MLGQRELVFLRKVSSCFLVLGLLLSQEAREGDDIGVDFLADGVAVCSCHFMIGKWTCNGGGGEKGMKSHNGWFLKPLQVYG